MKPLALGLVMLFAITATLFAQERDVSKWIEIPRPWNPKSAKSDLWDYSATQSTNVWRVFRDGQTVHAALATRTNLTLGGTPEFKVEAENFYYASAAIKVSDGWLVGFNRGEWGGALYWFNPDGTKKYKISKDHIVGFVRCDNGVFAISGIAHMGLSYGRILSILQPSNQPLWQIATQWNLPDAPRAVIQHPEANLLVVLSDSLVSFTIDGKIKTIVKEGRWWKFTPNSVVLSDDAKTAYVGMRQFVAKITLRNGRVSFFVPDRSYLNQLPKE